VLWGLIALGFAVSLASLAGGRRRIAYYRSRLPDRTQSLYLPPVTLIVPVKGPDHRLAENLAALATLDYPDYELIVATRRPEDIPPGAAPAKARIVLAGGGDARSSDKIANLSAAVRAASPRTAVLAFADSDGQVAPGWLRALVAPLENEAAGASTGYRCHLPERPGVWSVLRSVWDSGVLASYGPGPRNFAWGGAMAVRKEVFVRLGVLERWSVSVSDDFAVTAAVRAAGLALRFAPGALAVNAAPAEARECLAWIRRQLVLTRVYLPGLWWRSFAVSAVYCGALAACLAGAARGRRGHALAGTALVALWAAKGHHRGALARMALPEHAAWFRRDGWTFAWLAPLATALWLYGHVASAGSNTIQWRGRTYRLHYDGRSCT
jgi:GT2 family glycosyltransferase